MSSIHSQDLYERLELSPAATREEIRRAYHRLLRLYPPERAPEEFKRIRESYETLYDPQSREEYDDRPDPIVFEWLHLAMQAMDAKEHETAERHFKQVLIQAPHLDFVRNMLGLCFLYQEKAEQAIAQYERLLSSESPPAVWYGNAGHAYRLAGRLDEAAEAFRQAIIRGDDPVDYYVGLADVYLEEKQYDRAAKMLEKAITSDGKVDFQDLRFFTKLLEIRLLQGDLDGVHSVTQRMRGIVADAEQGSYVAWKLGTLAKQLLVLHAMEPALPVARTARDLQPQDGDYQALHSLAERMNDRDLAGALQLIRSHRSFEPDGWLREVGESIENLAREVFGEASPAGPRVFYSDKRGNVRAGAAPHAYRSGRAATPSRSGPGGTGEGTGIPPWAVQLLVWVGIIFLLSLCSEAGKSSRASTQRSAPAASRPPTSSPVSPATGSTRPGVLMPADTPMLPAAGAIIPGLPADTPMLPIAGGQRSPTSVPSSQRNPRPATDSRSSLGAWIDAERPRLESQERELNRLDASIDAVRADLESLRQQIVGIETRNPNGIPSSVYERYSAMVDRHNAFIDRHDELVAQYNRLLDRYESAIAHFNREVNRYNAMRR
jgi:tetratricopeptide (TPR) repeat protein